MSYKEEKYIDLDGQELTKITFSCGTIWYKNKNGLEHRLDGPALIWDDGSEFWFKNGKRHREDGPAEIDIDGTVAWYINGNKYSKEEYYKAITNLNPMNTKHL